MKIYHTISTIFIPEIPLSEPKVKINVTGSLRQWNHPVNWGDSESEEWNFTPLIS